MVHDLAIPQDSCRVWTVARGFVRVVYIFQADQKWMDQLHSYIKSQKELNEKNPYYELDYDNILLCVGMKNDFMKEVNKNQQLKPLLQDFIKDNFNDYKSLKIGREQSKKSQVSSSQDSIRNFL